jgi:hypothetical protein
MLALRGNEWLAEWHAYYDAVDGVANDASDQWIIDHQVSLIVDPRPGAEERLRELAARVDRQIREVAPGVWRLAEAP